MKRLKLFCLPVFAAALILGGCASWGAISAEEYFSIGMAYFDLGRFEEAERWLNRARSRDRTLSASEYNLGRIAFETGRFQDAARHFESILRRDPVNVLALQAAAYTRIRTGEIEKAAAFYQRLLAIVPESADDGYNYALVLYAMERYEEAELMLRNNAIALLDNNDILLLHARLQRRLEKPEAIDSFARWLANNTDQRVRYEYAQLLEMHTLYARALEEYRTVHAGITPTSVDPSRPEVRFTIARLLLIADADSAEGITELNEAVDEGYADFDEIEKLLTDERISAANRDQIRLIVIEGRRAEQAAADEDDDDSVNDVDPRLRYLEEYFDESE